MSQATISSRDQDLARAALRRDIDERRRDIDVIAQAIADARLEGFNAAMKIQDEVDQISIETSIDVVDRHGAVKP